jgi:hypothetical protein
MILRRIAVLGALVSFVRAACDYTFDSVVSTFSPFINPCFLTVTQAPTAKLTDLRSAVPFTFIDSYTLASCGTVKTTATVFATIYLSGIAYPADKSEEYVMGAATTGLVTWEFPQLLLKDLVPGEIATVVRPPTRFCYFSFSSFYGLVLMGV